MKIAQPPADTRWVVTQCWLLDHPVSINTDDLTELRSRLQALADEACAHRPPSYAFGPLSYRYECDEHDRVNVVHAYFVGRDKLNKRFMKLRRD